MQAQVRNRTARMTKSPMREALLYHQRIGRDHVDSVAGLQLIGTRPANPSSAVES